MKKIYRVFSLVLALMLCVSLLSGSALALDLPDMGALQSVLDAVAESEEAVVQEDGSVVTEETGNVEDPCETENAVMEEVTVEAEKLAAEENDTVVLYSTMTERALNAVIACFNQVYPNIEVQVVNGSAGMLISRLRSEAENPVADVMWGGLSDSDGDTNADVFESWVSENDAGNLQGYMSTNGMYSMTHLSTVVFCVNTELEAELGLEIDSYGDLLDAELIGLITTGDPNSASSAWNNLSNIMAVYGEDSKAAWTYVEELMPNLVILGSSSQVFRQVQQGEYVVGLTYEDGAVTLLEDGAENVKLVYPAEGTSATAYGAALVKGAPHEENAKLLIDFLCSEEGQEAISAYMGGTLRFANAGCEMPENSWLPDSDEIVWVSRDREYLAANKNSILEKWNAILAGEKMEEGGESVAINAENFPDALFLAYVSENFDTDGDGSLSAAEIANVTEIDCGFSEITSLEGIEFFTELEYLYCSEARNLGELDLSANTKLSSLYCVGCGLTELDLTKLTELRTLECCNNALGKLDLSANTKLRMLHCGECDLTELDVTELTNLWFLGCEGNPLLEELDLSANTGLEVLYISDCGLTEVDLSGLTKLESLSCENNAIGELSADILWQLSEFSCDEENIGGIDLTATESGYTADFSSIAHLIDSTWEIRGEAGMWEPAIAAAYDAQTGMATFSSRPKVISFGAMEENEWGSRWKNYITIYVSDADLPQLGMATDLRWGVEYDWQWDEETGGWSAVAVEHPGMMSWTAAEISGETEMCVRLYKVENGAATTMFSNYWRAAASGENYTDEGFVEFSPESGDYYFTIQYIGDGVTCRSGEIAVSEIWSYTKPDSKLDTCMNPVWIEDGIACWDAVEGKCFDSYEVFLYRVEAEGDVAVPVMSWWGGKENYDSIFTCAVPEHMGEGDYCFRVRAISSDITKCCNGEWSEYSEYYYYDGTSKHTLGDVWKANYTACGGGWIVDHYSCEICGYICDAEGNDLDYELYYKEGDGNHRPGEYVAYQYTKCGGGTTVGFYWCEDCGDYCDENGETLFWFQLGYKEGDGNHTPGVFHEADYTECGGGITVDYYICKVCENQCDENGIVLDWEKYYKGGNGCHTPGKLYEANYTECMGGFKENYYRCADCITPCDEDGNEIWVRNETGIGHDYEDGVCLYCGGLIGDLNGDGSYGPVDLILLMKRVLGYRNDFSQWITSDVNTDGKTDILDVIKMLRRLAG